MIQIFQNRGEDIATSDSQRSFTHALCSDEPRLPNSPFAPLVIRLGSFGLLSRGLSGTVRLGGVPQFDHFLCFFLKRKRNKEGLLPPHTTGTYYFSAEHAALVLTSQECICTLQSPEQMPKHDEKINGERHGVDSFSVWKKITQKQSRAICSDLAQHSDDTAENEHSKLAFYSGFLTLRIL